MQLFSSPDSTNPDMFAALVARLGGAEAIEALARRHSAFHRARHVKTPTDLLRLILAYAPGGRSLRRLAAEAAATGVVDVSDVALLARFRRCGDWLIALCENLLARRDEPAGGRARPDRGYPQPDGMRATRDAGADLLVRLTWNSLNLRNRAGEPVDWLDLFAKADVAGHVDMPVTVHKARRRFEPLPMRLVVTPKPPDIAERARDVARHNARKDQRNVDPRTLRAAGYMILITSLDAAAFPPQWLVRLYRVRWQIELAFKRLKSILRLDRLPAKDPGLARAWIAAHLLLALLIEDTTAQTQMADFSPSQS